MSREVTDEETVEKMMIDIEQAERKKDRLIEHCRRWRKRTRKSYGLV